MKIKILLSLMTVLGFAACGGGPEAPKPVNLETPKPTGNEVHGTLVTEVKLNNPLDQALVKKGHDVYDMKCASCHKLTEEKLVGPGWKGVTQKRQPAWIINMITNVDTMLESDPEAQKLLEQCLIRMPNQNVSSDDALAILEFMRSNDGNK